MRPGHRLLIGIMAVASFSVGIGGYSVRASASSNASSSLTDAQAGFLHPARTFTPSAGEKAGHVTCAVSNAKCTDLTVFESEKSFGHYVGHDEPSNLFESSIAGSGNEYRAELQLPVDPPTQPTQSNGVSWTFMESVAPWFGMALCNDNSYPEVQTTTGSCKPDSDSNIADCSDPTGASCVSTATGCPPSVTGSACYIGNHVGSAYMEFQFYPPGWAPQYPNETTGGVSCDAKLWCAAMVVWSYGSDAAGDTNNTCNNEANGGVEYGNYAFITHSGKTPTPANPLNANAFYPNPSYDLYMNSGDYIVVTLHDVPDSTPGPNGSGLEIDVDDLTTGETGSMVASTQNGFAMEKWDPTGSSCTLIPYNFHPMYSTSGTHTRVPWAAHTYNVSFTDEIGHFDFCSNVTEVNNATGGCSGDEGPSGDEEAAEADEGGPGGDDSVCYNGTLGQSTTLVPLPGCIGANLGFDGVSYQPGSTNELTNNNSTFWPNSGTPTTRPTPIRFTSFLTGPNYDQNYSDQAFENDLPALEFVDSPAEDDITNSTCDIFTGGGCTNQPPTDDSLSGGPTQYGFYPFFSDDTHNSSQCWWMIGQDVTGETSNDFDGGIPDSQYGQTGVGSVAYHVPFILAANPVTGQPIATPATEDFRTYDPTNTDQFGPYANPNSCLASAITIPSNGVPEAPTVPALFVTGGAAAALLLGGDALRRRRARRAA